ncbi:hypothetical protein [Salegentibacter chungangensis]|uniref:DUF805 domain-containing protein n=1 Tax=Salegentibacter chungangensis TaxID=1335724 RepID=A0ABW3NU91_9FLAO
MEDKTELLESFSNNKLIDIIKNYRQYGYDNSLRKTACRILKERGISINDLKLTGNLRNENFESAQEYIRAYRKNSKHALIFYITTLILNVLIPVFERISSFYSSIALALSIISIILFLYCLFRAFQHQSDFYRLIGKKMDSYEVLAFLLIGMPFYIFMYFYYKHKLKDELKLIK